MAHKITCDNCKRAMTRTAKQVTLGKTTYKVSVLSWDTMKNPIADICTECLILGLKNSMKPKRIN